MTKKCTKIQRERKAMEMRLPLVYRMVLRRKSEGEIRIAVKEQLHLKTYSPSTVHKDVIRCLEIAEKDMLDSKRRKQREILEINDTCSLLWDKFEEQADVATQLAIISEIRSQQQERRKLNGDYSAEKKEVSGDMTFTNLLMMTGTIDDNPNK